LLRAAARRPQGRVQRRDELHHDIVLHRKE
jgi:hypothetical protein